MYIMLFLHFLYNDIYFTKVATHIAGKAMHFSEYASFCLTGFVMFLASKVTF